MIRCGMLSDLSLSNDACTFARNCEEQITINRLVILGVSLPGYDCSELALCVYVCQPFTVAKYILSSQHHMALSVPLLAWFFDALARWEYQQFWGPIVFAIVVSTCGYRG